MITLEEKQIAATNLDFMRSPSEFLGRSLLDSQSLLPKSISDTIPPNSGLDFLANCQEKIDFNIVPVQANKFALTMVKKATNGPSIKARFLGFQFNVSGPSQMAQIEASNDTEFIFTVGLSGCTIIGVRSETNDALTFFHEPTKANHRDKWINDYPGRVVLRAAPTSKLGTGTAVMHFNQGKWQVYIQTFECNIGEMTRAMGDHNPQAGETFRFYHTPTLEIFEEE